MTSNSPFSDLPDHLQIPHIRQFQPIPMKKEGKVIVGLRDPFQLSKETLALPGNLFTIVQKMNGETSAEDIANRSLYVDCMASSDLAG